MYHDTFVLKAIEEWGFNPEKPERIQKGAVYLNNDEKKIMERIKLYQEYGIDTRTDEEKEASRKEFRLNMYRFVKGGGTLTDMPDELRNSEFVRNMYYKVLKKVYEIE